jgi:hypothetical protein
MLDKFLISALLLGCAQAGVIYSTDGNATPGFFGGVFWTVINEGSAGTSAWAMPFTVSPGHSGVLASLLVPVFSFTSFTEPFYVVPDSSGAPGSTILDHISVTIPGNPSGPTAQLLEGLSTKHPLLAAGQSYWLEAGVPPASPEEFDWFGSSPLLYGTVYISAAGGPWSPQTHLGITAFALESGAPSVPEPSSWLLSATGVALVLCGRRWLHVPLGMRGGLPVRRRMPSCPTPL